MSRKKSKSKSDFVNLFLQAADNESSDKGMAREFLASEGVNVDRMVSDGLKRIRQMQVMAEANKTEQEMFASEKIKAQATQWVDELLSKVDFSLPELVKKEELTVSFRNVEHLSQEDIRVILIRHFTLKFLNQQKDNQK